MRYPYLTVPLADPKWQMLLIEVYCYVGFKRDEISPLKIILLGSRPFELFFLFCLLIAEHTITPKDLLIFPSTREAILRYKLQRVKENSRCGLMLYNYFST